jgi:Sulfatase
MVPLAQRDRARFRSFLDRHRAALADAGVALSLANLCFINVWTQIFDPLSMDFFQRAHVPNVYLSVTLANILLVSAVLYLGISLTRRWSGSARAWADVGFLGMVLVPLNTVRARLLHVEFHGLVLYALLVGVPLGAAWIVWKRPRGVVPAVRGFLLVFLPLLPLGLAEVAIQRSWAAPSLAAFNRRSIIPRIDPDRPRHLRVVWMIFDEFDACFAFSRRSPDVRLPELDRLRAGAVYADRARSPAADTVESLPSLFTGKIVAKSSVANIGDLRIRYRDGSGTRLWSREPNVFADAHALGFNTGVAGWFLPYCRLFPFAACESEPIYSIQLREEFERYGSFPESMRLQLKQQMTTVPGLYRLVPSIGGEPWTRLAAARRASREQAILEYRGVHEAAVGELRQRDLDIVFVHWPAPHLLVYFDRRTGDFSTGDGPNYFDALALVDRTVGDIRAVLEQDGAWEETALLVSSDHPFRTDLVRSPGPWSEEEQRAMPSGECAYVPFLLKMPGQRQAVRYDRDFNTVVSGNLLLAVLRGEVKTAEDATRWLTVHGR